MNDLTNTKENIVPEEKRKAVLSLENLDIRDYFAAKAMQGFCVSTVEDSPVGGWDFKYLAEHAYRCADAMIAEREK